MELMKIGVITTTHGIKGEVKIMGDNPCFRKGFDKALYLDSKPMVEVHLNNVRKQGDKLIVSFKEFNDINQVEKYRGLAILADKETLDELDDKEYYIKDLIGMEVYNELDEYKGEVREVRKYPQGFYLEVYDNDDNLHLIPFIDEFIKDVRDIIIVKEIEGLF